MNREELKLSLVEVFSKSPPTPIEINEEIFSELKSEFWRNFKEKLDFHHKEGSPSFTVNKACVRWWNSTNVILYKYTNSTEQEKQKVFATFTYVMCAELDGLGIPYEIEDDYYEGLKRFRFNIAKLKEFSNVGKLRSLL